MLSSSSVNTSSKYQLRNKNNTKNAEFVAVVLASSIGTRLYPITDGGSTTGSTTKPTMMIPKHMLPIAGIPLLLRLLTSIELCGFTECIISIKHDDTVTKDLFQRTQIDGCSNPYTVVGKGTTTTTGGTNTMTAGTPVVDNNENKKDKESSEFESTSLLSTTSTTTHGVMVVRSSRMKITMVQYDSPTSGTIDAIRRIDSYIPNTSNIVVFPSDVLILDVEPIRTMIQTHRLHQSNYHNNMNNHHDFTSTSATNTVPQQPQLLPTPTTSTASPMHQGAAACTVLLVDVAAFEEPTGTTGIMQPIFKESAKQKKELLSRDEDDIEYVAIHSSSTHEGTSTTTNRLIWKQAKFDVEEDKDQIGTTPKLKVPKFRLYHGSSRDRNATTQIGTEWNDVHVYCLSSWVRQLIQRKYKSSSVRFQSIQYDLIPLLISRQYRGMQTTFSSSNSIKLNPVNHSTTTTNLEQPADTSNINRSGSNDEYMVLAHISKSRTVASVTPTIFRSHTISSYLFANRILAHELSAMNVVSLQQQQQQKSSTLTTVNPLLQVPIGTTIQSKFHTLLLSDCTIGEKVTFKSCVIGDHCTIGNNCKLNNVIVHDHVNIGDNTTIQGTIIGSHVTIGANCNFNDCQILHHTILPLNTKKKGEAITGVDE